MPRRAARARRVIADEGTRAALAAVTETAEHTLHADGIYTRELASWAPAPGSTRHDGVPHTAYPVRGERTSRTSPAGISLTADGAPPGPAWRRDPGPRASCACSRPPLTARLTG